MKRPPAVLATLPVLALLGCGAPIAPQAPVSMPAQTAWGNEPTEDGPRDLSPPTRAPSTSTCGERGEYVSGSAEVDAGEVHAIRVHVVNVGARHVVTEVGVRTEVDAPLAFVARMERPRVHFAQAVVDTSGASIDANVDFDLVAPLGRGRARLHSSSFDFAAPCAGAFAGEAARRAQATPPESRRDATYVRSVNEVAVHPDADRLEPPIAWIAPNTGLYATLGAPVGTSLAITVYGYGVVVRGFVAPNLLLETEERGGLGMFGSGSGGGAPCERLFVRNGTPVYATPTASTPWARTTGDLEVHAVRHDSNRYGAWAIETATACQGESCASERHDRRAVSASLGPDRRVAIWLDEAVVDELGSCR